MGQLFRLFSETNMILIAESGSTRTSWCILYDDQSVEMCHTSGINPFFLPPENIRQLLESEFTLPKDGISSVFFYGAGCGWPDKRQIISDVLSAWFGTTNIDVNSDLLAAARSLCQDRKGIACILGTGSNSCLYDGNKITQNVPPLGFILGDEGGGAYMGKTLLSGILKNQLPEAICKDFFTEYPVTVDEILENVYRKPFPNRYLAQYAKFIAGHIHEPEMNTMVETGFREFFGRNIMQYPGVLQLPIHFTGSIAFFFRKQLEKVALSYGITVGNISQEPMQGLIKYHCKELPG